MTKFLIVSDTHGDREIIVDIFDKWRDSVAGIFYNGDSELAADDTVFDGVSTVIGNMDDDPDFVAARATTIDGITFFQTHGHLYDATQFNAWANLKLMATAAQEANAQVALFGHTHLEGAVVFDDILFINPGSIRLPKGPHANLGGTYAVLDVTETRYDVRFYNRQHQPLPQLAVQVAR